MKLFVGLGNPGQDHALNRHNVGFMAVDAIAAAHGFADWRKRFDGLAAEGRLGQEQVLLFKPETFMNASGRAAGEAARFYKLDPAGIVVFHDELDLAPGKIRVKTGGGMAGHNGLRSMTAHIGNEYVRVRIGIGHPGRSDRVKGYVLHNFAKAEFRVAQAPARCDSRRSAAPRRRHGRKVPVAGGACHAEGRDPGGAVTRCRSGARGDLGARVRRWLGS